MKKTTTILLAFIVSFLMLTVNVVIAQTTLFNNAWQKDYQNTPTDNFSNEGRKVVVNQSTGNVYVLADVTSDLDSLGNTTGLTYSYTVLIMFDSLGNFLSTRLINIGSHTVSGFDRSSAFGMEIDGSGNLYVAYNSSSATTSFDVNIAKFSASLTPVWNYVFNPVSADQGIDFKINATGTAYCLVKSTTSTGAVRYRIIRASGAGSSQLTYYNNSLTTDIFTSMALDNASNIYLAGYRPSTTTGVGKIIAVTSINGTAASTGNVRWSFIDNCGTVSGDDIAKHIVVGPDGNVFFTGSSTGITSHGVDAVTMKLSSVNGKKIWENFINYTLTDGGFLVNVPDSNVVNVAWTSGSSVNLEQLQNNGNALRRIGFTPTPLSTYTALGQSTITNMVVSNAKCIYIAGTINVTNSGNNFNAAWLVKINPSLRGGMRIENSSLVEGTFNISQKSISIALDQNRSNVYWLRDFTSTASSHLQEIVTLSLLEGTGTFREFYHENSVAVEVYPNPTVDQLFVKTNSSDAFVTEKWQVMNMAGQVLLYGIMNEVEPIDVSNLSDGTYLLKIEHHPPKRFIKQSR